VPKSRCAQISQVVEPAKGAIKHCRSYQKANERL